MTPLGFLLLNC